MHCLKMRCRWLFQPAACRVKNEGRRVRIAVHPSLLLALLALLPLLGSIACLDSLDVSATLFLKKHNGLGHALELVSPLFVDKDGIPHLVFFGFVLHCFRLTLVLEFIESCKLLSSAVFEGVELTLTFVDLIFDVILGPHLFLVL